MIELPVTALFGGLFALLMIPMTVAVGLCRARTRVLFYDGGNDTLRRVVRAHGNYLENMPVALILMAVAEINNASVIFLYVMGTVFLLARVLHYLTLNFFDKPVFRVTSMLTTMGTILGFGIWLLLAYWRHIHGL